MQVLAVHRAVHKSPVQLQNGGNRRERSRCAQRMSDQGESGVDQRKLPRWRSQSCQQVLHLEQIAGCSRQMAIHCVNLTSTYTGNIQASFDAYLRHGGVRQGHTSTVSLCATVLKAPEDFGVDCRFTSERAIK